MGKGMGHKKWCIPDLYMKEPGNRPTPSHESITIFNTGEETAEVGLTLVFDSRENTGRIAGIQVKPMQARQIRMDNLEAWNMKIPVATCYSAILESSKNVVVEYARFNWIDGAAQSFAVIPYFED